MTRSPRAEALIEAAAALKGKAGSGAVLKLKWAETMRELAECVAGIDFANQAEVDRSLAGVLVLTEEVRCE